MSAAPRVGVTVLVVDDQPMFRRAVSSLVRSVIGLQLVGEASSGEEAVQLAMELVPDLILMDVRLPGIDGTEATRQILARLPLIRVVLVSTYDEADLPLALGECGAVRFLRKQDLDAEALLAAAG